MRVIERIGLPQTIGPDVPSRSGLAEGNVLPGPERPGGARAGDSSDGEVEHGARLQLPMCVRTYLLDSFRNRRFGSHEFPLLPRSVARSISDSNLHVVVASFQRL